MREKQEYFTAVLEDGEQKETFLVESSPENLAAFFYLHRNASQISILDEDGKQILRKKFGRFCDPADPELLVAIASYYVPLCAVQAKPASCNYAVKRT